MTFCDVLIGIGESIAAAVVVGISLYLFQSIRYFIFLRCRYNNRLFDIYFKDNYKEGKGEVIGFAKCSVNIFSNKIKYEGRIEKTGERDFKGEFLMNPLRLKLGDGYQYHTNYDGFNFPKMLIKDKNIFFLQTNFVTLENANNNPTGNFRISYKGYIWKRK